MAAAGAVNAKDPDFPFPDYLGEEMTIQDCWVAFEKRYVQDAVRSLMHSVVLSGLFCLILPALFFCRFLFLRHTRLQIKALSLFHPH